MDEQATESQPQQGHWFVVHTLSGQEMKVKQRIETHRELEGVEEFIHEVLIPTEKVSETRGGKKTVVNRKFFPGYILVLLDLYDGDGNIIEPAWYFIRNTQGIIGFVGGEKPVPLSEREVEDILSQTREEGEQPKPKVSFEVGETVAIRDGAFENFEGTIEHIDPDRGKLKLSVSIFGRSTPVEVEYWQVERG
mgnify:FL=1